MKKIFLFISFIILVSFVNAQYSLYIDFENTANLQYVKIDTGNQNNLWQIGTPSKTFFTGAYSAPNAIVTDTVISYQVSNHSSFIITIKSSGWFWGSPSTMSFYHKYNTDQGKDGGYIDVSYNGGGSWQNILHDTILKSCPTSPYSGFPWFSNLYSNTDTLDSGIPAFSGNSNGWKQTEITWLFCLGVKQWPPDSVMLRFNFVSDSIQTHKDGWMMDNFLFNSGPCGEVSLGLPTRNILSRVYPNPTSNKLTIETSFESTKAAQINIISIEGKEVLKQFLQHGKTDLDISGLAKGVYFLRLNTDDTTEVTKFVKE